MEINKLEASFGSLQNESIKFHEGLNIIADPVPDRKSDWCAFIRCMLYGVETERRAGAASEKQLYAPESGEPMSGSMDLKVNGYNISLSRSSRSKSAPMREFSALYSRSGEKLQELHAGV